MEDLREIAEELSDISIIEAPPKLEGRVMSMVLTPSKPAREEERKHASAALLAAPWQSTRQTRAVKAARSEAAPARLLRKSLCLQSRMNRARLVIIQRPVHQSRRLPAKDIHKHSFVV